MSKSQKSKVEEEILDLRLKDELLKRIAAYKIHEILDHDRELRYIQ